MNLVHPVIVIPGITATYLKDEYRIPPEDVWKVLSKKYDRVALHPNNLKYEAKEPARIQPGQIFEVAYEELIEELRYNLRLKEDEQVPVYPFGYDWRMPLEIIEKQLDSFITEVIERTKLLKHYHREDYQNNARVNLVAHSMGGLIVTGYLKGKGRRAPVNKVVTLATPYRGSLESIAKVATGTANLGTTVPSSREREAARLTPSLYHLLPSFTKGINLASGLPESLFNIKNWQPSVASSISEFIRLNGLPTRQRQTDAKNLLHAMLDEAKNHRDRISSFRFQQSSLRKKDWLAIVGVDVKTRVKLNVVKREGKPFFEFKSGDRMNDWGKNNNENWRFTGDGTVPYEGAVPTFLNESNLVCITPEDYGYWEVQDRALSKAAGFHGILPNMNMLHRLIVRFFAGRPDNHNNTWGRRAPGASTWNPPLALDEKKD